MVKYIYNAWGNCKVLDADGTENVATDFIGNLNPYRYRGYYFDVETGLYYLVSRYYAPSLCRFISRDSFEYANPDAINGINLYAYCNDNPVMNVDPTGTAWWHWLIGVAIVAALVVATVVSAGGATAGAIAIVSAVNGAVAVGASLTTTVFAFAAVGAGTMLSASAVAAGVHFLTTISEGGSISDA